MKYKESENQSFESESDIRTSTALNFFWFGFILYTICYIYPGIGLTSTKYLQAGQIASLFFLIPSAYYLIRWDIESVYLKVFFQLFILWSVITILRGFAFNYNFIKTILFNAPFSIFLYLVPLILVFRNPVENLKKLFIVIIILNISYLFFIIQNFNIIYYGIGPFRLPTALTESFSSFLSLPAGFILLTYLYHSKKKIFFSLLVLILTFLLATLRARRGLMFMTVCLLFFSYIVFYFTNKGKILKAILSISLILFVVFYAYMTYNSNQSGRFNILKGRIDEDTRSGVEECFKSGMSTTDLIIGKGINGSYYCLGISEIEGTVTTYRTVIETGYLQIILKMGYFGLAIYLLIIIPAIFNALFKSKNLLSKACGIWILLFTLFLYPTVINMFYLNYLILWLSVGICYNKQIRQKTDEDLKTLFHE